MNKKIATLILGVLLMAIVSAGLVSYFAKITGTVEVEGPVFYLDGTELETDIYNLTINQYPFIIDTFNITNNEIIFITDSLNINEFYKADFDIYISMRENSNNSYLDFEIIKKTSSDEINICGPKRINTGSSSFSVRHTLCSSSEDIDFDEEDKIGLKISGMAELKVGFPYASDGYSRIEVSAT